MAYSPYGYPTRGFSYTTDAINYGRESAIPSQSSLPFADMYGYSPMPNSLSATNRYSSYYPEDEPLWDTFPANSSVPCAPNFSKSYPFSSTISSSPPYATTVNDHNPPSFGIPEIQPKNGLSFSSTLSSLPSSPSPVSPLPHPASLDAFSARGALPETRDPPAPSPAPPVAASHSGSMRELTAVKEYVPPSATPVVTQPKDEPAAQRAPPAGKSTDGKEGTEGTPRRNNGRRKNGRVTDSNSQLLAINPATVLQDARTTLMIRNVPNSFTQEVLLKIINGYIANRFDFFYLPIDFHTQCNLGYCYINVVDVQTVRVLYDHVGPDATLTFSFITNIGRIRHRRKPARFAMPEFKSISARGLMGREWTRCWSTARTGPSCISPSSSAPCSTSASCRWWMGDASS